MTLKRLALVTVVLAILPASWLPCSAGAIENALNLPGMGAVKADVAAGKVSIELKKLDPVKDENGEEHTVVAEQEGSTLRLNSDVYGESTDPGILAQHILHEHTHYRLKHEGNCKENEVEPRTEEAKFWRAYKASHPGVTSSTCDANEKAVYANGSLRSKADMEKQFHDSYGYPDDPDGKQKSSCIYEVHCPGGDVCTLMLDSSVTSLHMDGDHMIVPDSSTATIVFYPPDPENISRFAVTQYEGSAGSIAVPGFEATGENKVILDPSRSSYGYIDHDTNEVTLYLYSRITNRLYDARNPILVRTHGQGRFVPGPGGGTLTIDTLAFDAIPVGAAAIPSLTGWGAVVLLLLLGGCGAVLARRWSRAARTA